MHYLFLHIKYITRRSHLLLFCHLLKAHKTLALLIKIILHVSRGVWYYHNFNCHFVNKLTISKYSKDGKHLTLFCMTLGFPVCALVSFCDMTSSENCELGRAKLLFWLGRFWKTQRNHKLFSWCECMQFFLYFTATCKCNTCIVHALFNR